MSGLVAMHRTSILTPRVILQSVIQSVPFIPVVKGGYNICTRCNNAVILTVATFYDASVYLLSKQVF